jgi:hypothetical protein
MILWLVACDGGGDDEVAAPAVLERWFGVPGEAGSDDDRAYLPLDVAFSADGSAAFVDYNNHRVRRVSVRGEVTTLAGTGFAGVPEGCEAGCDALSTPLSHPTDVQPIDGEWWIGSNAGVWSATEVGTLTTRSGLAATSVSGPYGYVPGSAQIVTLVDGAVFADAPDSGPNARVTYTSGVLYAPAGDVVVDVTTGAPEEVPGTEGVELIDVAVGPAGELYVADHADRCVRVVVDGTAEVVAGVCGEGGEGVEGAVAAETPLADVWGIAVDPAGDLYVSEASRHVIWRVAR